LICNVEFLSPGKGIMNLPSAQKWIKTLIVPQFTLHMATRPPDAAPASALSAN
jgi:hypothetical protein